MLSTTGNASSQEAARASPPTAENRTQHAPTRVRRRNRQINSCLECRRRKLKCDKGSPCANCTKNGRPCIFIASSVDADAQKKLAEVKEKMGVLEQSLEDDVVRLSRSRNAGDERRHIALPGQDQTHSDQEDDEDAKNLDMSSFVTEDAAYYDDDVNNDDDLDDLGIAIGRMRITERIGGLVRPRFAEEFTQALRALPPSNTAKPAPLPEEDPKIWLAPSRDYVAPSSSFLFSPKASVMSYLPAKFVVDNMILVLSPHHYWDAVHIIARMVHRPSFERQLERFWAAVNAGTEPRASLQAVVFAMLLSSVVSMHENAVLAEFGMTKEHFVGTFRHCCEAALSQSNFLRSTKLEPLQAFVMYLIPLCRGEVSRGHSALTGTAIRLAECMGLHRDPTSYSNSPVEIQVRRLVWHQICFLDMRTSEATGPRPQIRHGDYDTCFPLNIDDEDLDLAEAGEREVDVKHDRKHFTTMTVTRMRFECHEMTKLIYFERTKLEQKRANGDRKVTLVSLLSRIQSFKAAMEETYLPMLSKSVSLHALASEIYGILSNRIYVILLQKYLSSDRSRMPTRLRQLVMSASVSILEHSMNIEIQPALSTWSWYLGALSTHHPALLLLNEVYTAQNDPEVEARIWRCMDYAFGLEAANSSEDNFRSLLEDLVRKTTIYTNMKGIRAPSHMPHAGPRTLTNAKARRREEQQQNSTFRSEPGTSSTTVAGPSARFPAQQISPPSQTQHVSTTTQTRPYNQQATRPPMSFPGAVPNVDWGTIDFPGPLPSLHAPFSSSEVFNFNDYTASMTMTPMVPSGTLAGMSDRHGSDTTSSSGLAAYGTTGSSPMDALNDMDWNEIEKMFGSAETVSGMMVPPFSFPQFEPSDLNM
ncbi:hypothetical protein DE146DRAFT_679330 [Phaeosphaeria sp. MPI-PUGE-AT-0046c]|nr:hypothetical protein DE146DRAFT_679330 [Phaeosphaeria sp. MPI-PUGE-AT-0046c]